MTDLTLDARAGLPPELRVLADRYPRGDWRGHPNFNELTAFWLERHGMFRDLTNRLVTLSRDELDSPRDRFLPEMSRYAGFLLNQLHSHHMIEDHHYFPQFQALDSRVARAFELLDADHHTLHAGIDRFAEIANAAIASPGRDSTAALLSMQEEFRRLLTRHLEDEEDVIVPLVLEYGAELG